MNTEERINEIINEFQFEKKDIETKLLRLMLEALVIQAQLEQLTIKK